MNLGLVISAAIFWMDAIAAAIVWRDPILLGLGLIGIGSVNLSQMPEIQARAPGAHFVPVGGGVVVLAYILIALR